LFRVRTVKRSAHCAKFEDEKPQPKIRNLTTHTRESHEGQWLRNESADLGPSTKLIDHGYTAASAKLMAEFLEEGRLNPKKDPTQAGFLKHFAAWLLEDDLPFSTGESPGIARLFRYLQINFQLPKDTTVRNSLAHIYTELHAVVVKELTVRDCCDCEMSTYRHNRTSSQRFRTQPISGPLSRWSSHLRGPLQIS
jgi:hypothetical protein